MNPKYSPDELASALGLFAPTDEQAAVIAAPPGPLVVIAGAGAGKTETMAARVVWLVANGYASPGEVLGLTFTRKAAGQLLRRVRSRLARLAGTGIVAGGLDAADDPATVSTYHAFAGTLLREHGLLLPVEPDTRLLSETELWQLAFRVVTEHPGALDTEKTPAAVTTMVLRLAGQLAEHLVDTESLTDTHVELERLVHTLPAGPYQRDRGPSQWLLRMLATQTERTELVPLIDALHRRMRAEKVMDFGMQMASAARLASTFPTVGAQLRRRFRVVLLDEYQDTGHAQRVALSSLFGGGVDDDLALTAVGDPIQSIYGWRGASATNLPRFTTDFPLADGTPAPTLELRTSWRNPPRALYLANAVSAEARRRSVAVQPLRPRPGAEPGTIRCALLGDVEAEREWVADHIAERLSGGPRRGDTRADGSGARAPQLRFGADGRCPHRTGGAGRGRRAGRAARRHRGRRRGRHAAPRRRSRRGRRRHASAHRPAVAAGRPRHLGAVAPRRRTGLRGRRDGSRFGRPDRRRRRARRRHRLPGRRDQRPGSRGRLFGGRPSPDHRARSRVDRAARTSDSSAARPCRRGAQGARRRRRGPCGKAAVGGVERRRTPRRLRRRGDRLRGRASGCDGVGSARLPGRGDGRGERACARRNHRRAATACRS